MFYNCSIVSAIYSVRGNSTRLIILTNTTSMKNNNGSINLDMCIINFIKKKVNNTNKVRYTH